MTPARTASRSALGRLLASCVAVLGLASGGCVSPPPPSSVAIADRVTAFPTTGLPLNEPATIYWSDRQTPFIDAQHDDDVPLLMGMVHAHLRLGQMEILRRVAQGRIAESAGPLAADVDHALRTLDFVRGAEASERAMREDSKRWAQRYADGINAYRRLVPARSADIEFLAIGEEDWTVRDVLTVGRLASTDINWITFVGLLRLSKEERWPEVWARIKDAGARGIPSFGPDLPIDLAALASRSGSNAFVVAGSRTESRSGLIASDPHVGLQLPTLFVALGYRSPGAHVVGLTIPGIPAVVLGRNERIAWGGTNMQALSTSLYDVSKLPADQFTTERTEIRQRLWLSTTRTIRRTPLGPVITDAPYLNRGSPSPVAVRWRGHDASDELAAFLDVSRAENFEQFRRAFAPYAVSGQNFLYADADGNIGQLLALEYDPAAGRTARVGIADPTDPAMQWGSPIKSTELPFAYNPPEGYLVSANNMPVRTEPPITLTARADDRMRQIPLRIEQAGRLDADDAANIQTDVYSLVGHDTSRQIAALARAAGTTQPAELIALLETWDGHYTIDSRGAAAYQLVLHELATRAYTQKYGRTIARALMSQYVLQDLLLEDLRSESGGVREHIAPALATAAERLGPSATWGDLHRVPVSHWLGQIPVLGSSYRFGELPAPGSLTTVLKTGHAPSPGKHLVRWGAAARHVTDMGDLDENYFVLMGGQDGWPGSATFMDQIDLWQAGRLVQLPMRIRTVRAQAAMTTELTPAP